jgi:hypothetical protein
VTPWLLAQCVFAAFAWTLAARAVHRVAFFGGYAGKGLAATIRELRVGGRASEVPKLAEQFGETPLTSLLQLDADRVSAEELVSTAQEILPAIAPPIRVLRGLATIGTTLGLLAAVATLRQALDVGAATAMERAAAQAFDSAVAGFVTALPCWTAVALCRRRTWQTYAELDLVVLAMRAEGPATAQAVEGGAVVASESSERVDEGEPSR